MKRIILHIAPALLPLQLCAEVPKVVTDILPVHSLVARVMDGVGAPVLLVPANASPHVYSLRVSQAEALETVGLVVWVGPELTPWLDASLDALAGNAEIVTLLDAPGMRLLEARGDDEHGDHEGHADQGHDGHAQEGEGHDPHIWLDPTNAIAIVAAVSAALSEQDPEHADTYRANAKQTTKDLEALSGEISAKLAPVSERPFMVLHDAYQYFYTRFNLSYEGAILDISGASPGPKGLARAQKHLRDRGVSCIFTEPQLNDKLLDTVTENAEARRGGIDPLGADLAPGPALYSGLMRALATNMKTCLD